MFSNGLNISKILGGINSTINIANEVIPIYQKYSKTISKATTLIKKNITTKTKNNINKKNITIRSNISQNNNPNFFL